MADDPFDTRLEVLAQTPAELAALAAFVREVGPSAFLSWARDHRRWTSTVAEVAAEVCAKPLEAALEVARRIVEELVGDSTP